MSAEDVRTLEEAADTLMRLRAEETAIALYALALKLARELDLPPGQVVVGRG